MPGFTITLLLSETGLVITKVSFKYFVPRVEAERAKLVNEAITAKYVALYFAGASLEIQASIGTIASCPKGDTATVSMNAMVLAMAYGSEEKNAASHLCAPYTSPKLGKRKTVYKKVRKTKIHVRDFLAIMGRKTKSPKRPIMELACPSVPMKSSSNRKISMLKKLIPAPTDGVMRYTKMTIAVPIRVRRVSFGSSFVTLAISQEIIINETAKSRVSACAGSQAPRPNGKLLTSSPPSAIKPYNG